MKKVIELLESGLNMLNAENVKEAMNQFKLCEEICNNFEGQIDDNF